MSPTSCDNNIDRQQQQKVTPSILPKPLCLGQTPHSSHHPEGTVDNRVFVRALHKADRPNKRYDDLTVTCDWHVFAGEKPVQAPEARAAAVLVERLHVRAADALLGCSPDDLG